MSTAPSNPITAPLQPSLRQRVSVRRAALGPLPLTQTSDGWVVEPRLRCDSVRLELGATVGSASFTFVPGPSDAREVQDQLALFSIDDQVRVEVWPLPDQLDPTLDPESQAITLFEGELSRPSFSITADQNNAQELLTFTALPFPRIDQLQDGHRVLGRTVPAVSTPGSASPFYTSSPVLIEALSLPAIFNHQGRPNRSSVQTGNESETRWYLFSHDDDAFARPWTLRAALGWLIGTWIYGGWGVTLPRRFDIETTTAQLIFADPVGTLPTLFEGLDAVLPEVSVQGLGVLDAIEAVCVAGGFRLLVEPRRSTETGYLYHLAVRRRNTGTAVTLDLDHRNSTYASGEAFVAANNLSKFVGFRDGAEIVNQVRAVGRTFVECVLTLKPLWDPNDVATIPVTDELQDAPDAHQLQTHAYFSRHVQAGVKFAEYGSVGRAWGLDCVGELARPYTLYTSGLYAQTQPFDFVAALGLNASSQITQWRSEANLTDPEIRWSSRIRALGELRSPDAVAARRNFVLEVSENAGTTWSPLTTLGFTTLPHACGISLSIDNLALVNAAWYQSGDDREVPEVAQSWWQLFLNQQLLFRLHCTIEADHALQHIAQPSDSSTRQTRSVQMPLSVDELLVAPHTYFNTGSTWQRYFNPDAAIVSGNLQTLVRDPAERRRDATSQGQFSVVASIAVLDLQRYHLGDQVTRVRGRQWDLKLNNSTPPRYPTLAAITYTLSGTQGLELQLEDQRMTQGGGEPWRR